MQIPTNSFRSPLCAALLLLLCTGTLHAQDWTQWRGPNRDGHVPNATLPTKWPETLPTPNWRVPVGVGYSSPVVLGKQAFMMGRDEAGNEMCLALNTETGKILWKYQYPSSFVPPDPTAGTGPNSTPTVDKDRVYMLGLGGMLHCLDIESGRVLWKHDLAKEYWGVEKDETGWEAWSPPCGASTSALVIGEQVILSVGGKKAGSITAFDRKTGALLWKALDDRSSYASPLLTDFVGVSQIIGFTGKRMVGLDASDHKLLWEFPFTAMYEQTIVSPVLWGNRVIVSGEAKPVVALEISRENDKFTQKVAWQNPELATYLVTPVVFKDHLLGFDQKSRRLICIDLTSGTTTWTSPRIGKMFVSLTVAGEQILALSDSGELHVLAANPKEYKPVGKWTVAKEGEIWSNPAIVGNRLYIREKDHLTCYEFAKPVTTAKR